MIALGLRLVVSGGREAITRLAVLAVAVGLGVGLLLTAVAATNAAVTWNNRHAWFWTGTASAPAGPGRAGVAPLWWHPGGDIFDGQQINRFDVAATGASSPVPPGIPVTRDRASTTPRPRSPRCCAVHPGGPARPPLPRPPVRHDRRRRAVRRRTRWSSSSGAPRRSSRRLRTPCR